jgi:hypothetical protein
MKCFGCVFYNLFYFHILLYFIRYDNIEVFFSFLETVEKSFGMSAFFKIKNEIICFISLLRRQQRIQHIFCLSLDFQSGFSPFAEIINSI